MKNKGGIFMIKLNDYLYGGHTVLSILHAYARDLGIS